MTDFTKEELDILKTSLSVLDDNWKIRNDYQLKIWNMQRKIQSMIDNFDSAYECPSCHSKFRGENE